MCVSGSVRVNISVGAQRLQNVFLPHWLWHIDLCSDASWDHTTSCQVLVSGLAPIRAAVRSGGHHYLLTCPRRSGRGSIPPTLQSRCQINNTCRYISMRGLLTFTYDNHISFYSVYPLPLSNVMLIIKKHYSRKPQHCFWVANIIRGLALTTKSNLDPRYYKRIPLQ